MLYLGGEGVYVLLISGFVCVEFLDAFRHRGLLVRGRGLVDSRLQFGLAGLELGLAFAEFPSSALWQVRWSV